MRLSGFLPLPSGLLLPHEDERDRDDGSDPQRKRNKPPDGRQPTNLLENLGTRENLFFIDRLTGPDGSTRSYRFTGRGWGHGVGMCQVGAAGLAEAGASFVDILQHYYPGIRIEHAGGSGP